MIQKDIKEKLIKEFGKSSDDVGSCEVQIGLISERIRQISDHLKKAKKDFHSQRGLVILIGKRKAFLKYLKKNDDMGYQNVLRNLKEHGYM